MSVAEPNAGKQGYRLLSVGPALLGADLSANEQLMRIYRAVAASCERVDLIIPGLPPRGFEAVEANVWVHAGPLRPGLGGRLRYLAWAVRAGRRLQREQRFDAIWASDPFDAGLICYAVAAGSLSPVVMQLQGDMYRFSPARFGRFKRWLVGWLTTALSRRAARVRVLSRDLADQVVARGLPPERLTIVPARAEYDLFDPARWRGPGQRLRESWGWTDELVILYAGALNATKGPDLLVEALAATADRAPRLRLVVAGDGPMADHLAQQAVTLGVADRVRFAGWVPYAELPAYYAACDLTCVPSRDEGMGRGAIQGAAMERLAIVTAVGGNSELFRSGVDGWLVEPTADGLAQALLTAAALPDDERLARGRAAREASRGTFDFAPNIARMVDEMLVKVVGVRT